MLVRIRKARKAPRHPLYPDLKAVRARAAKKTYSALAGSFEELAQGYAKGARAARAVLVLHYQEHPWMSPAERDALWELFHVPVYGLLLDREGAVLGYECEAQHGLHLCADAAKAAESSACCCGRAGLVVTPEAEPVAQAAD